MLDYDNIVNHVKNFLLRIKGQIIDKDKRNKLWPLGYPFPNFDGNQIVWMKRKNLFNNCTVCISQMERGLEIAGIKICDYNAVNNPASVGWMTKKKSAMNGDPTESMEFGPCNGSFLWWFIGGQLLHKIHCTRTSEVEYFRMEARRAGQGLLVIY